MRMTLNKSKMHFIPSLLVFLAITQKIQGKIVIYNGGNIPFFTCVAQIESLATYCSEEVSSTDCFCDNVPAMGSMSECILEGHNTTQAVKYYTNLCGITKSELYTIYNNATEFARNTKEVADFNKSVPIDFPLIFNSTELNIYRLSYDAFYGNYMYAHRYGAGMLGYWATVFLILGLSNWTIYLFPNLVNHFTGYYTNLFRRHISLTALGTKKRMQHQSILKLFDCLIPTRLETMIVFGFMISVIGFCTAHIHTTDNNPRFPTKDMELARYVADRTGITASYMMPLVFLLPGRNNLLQWLTRLTYSNFVMFHRWISRIIVSLVFIHAVCFSYRFIHEGVYAEEFTDKAIKFGLLAIVSGGIICFQALLFFRRRWYEVFLFLHIALVTLFLAGAYIHTSPADVRYEKFYKACVGIWCTDRFVRLARIALFGCPLAEVVLVADETLRITVPRPSYWKPVPGGHVFIHFLRSDMFWQSHPFTCIDSIEQENTITLYCKVKNGVTSGMYRYLENMPNRTGHVRVLVEGPYGEKTAAARYENAVFIAGGNGIPGIYSEITNLASKSVEKHSLKLYWIIREWKSIDWFYPELLKLKGSGIETTIYVTRPETSVGNIFDSADDKFFSIDVTESKSHSSMSENSDVVASTNYNEEKFQVVKEDKQKLKESLPHIEFKDGRPQMNQIIKTEIEEANGSTAFITCGHPAMVDDIRRLLVQSLDETNGNRVDYFEQVQAWA